MADGESSSIMLEVVQGVLVEILVDTKAEPGLF